MLIAALLAAVFVPPLWAQRGALPGKTLLILPFQNDSKLPNLDWVGESFPEILGTRLAGFFVIDRHERLNALERMGLPPNLRPSRATAYQIAQAMEVDYVVVGSYAYDGQSFTARAQVLDMDRLHLSPAVVASGSLPSLIQVEDLLAHDLMHVLASAGVTSRGDLLSAPSAPRLDAFESYVRGLLATARQDKVARFREAVRLDPSYSQASFQLGKTLYEAREYGPAVAWLEHIPPSDLAAREAHFYLGICEFYLGHYEKSQNAFEFVAGRLPLIEVYNNLGVVAGRRDQKSAAQYFERAVQADPTDPDYRLNLAIAQVRNGDTAGAARQLRELLALRPSDGEAKALLEALNRPPVMSGTATTPATLRAADAKLPLERIKRNYDEASFRQLAFELDNQSEMRLAGKPAREHAQFHLERGQELLTQGFFSEAEKHFREAVILDPTMAAAHLGLARILSADHPPEARAEAHSALVLQPSAEGWLVLAQLDLRDNKLEGAQHGVEEALRLEPANAAALAMKRDIDSRLAEKSRTLTPR